MRVNVITNLKSGVGLQRDYEEILGLLQAHQVAGVHFEQPETAQPADVNLFLEVITPSVLRLTPHNWVMPNPEWWFDEYTSHLPDISLVLCKTTDSLRLMLPLAGKRVRYTGFCSRDLYRSDIPREPKFLHVAGNSAVKNTDIILEAWRRYSLPPLTLVTSVDQLRLLGSQMPNVTVRNRVSDEELTWLMNSHQYHLCPSMYEGFGHYLHEAMGVGAVVVTLDAPPMNDCGLAKELLVHAVPDRQLRLARLHTTTPEAIASKVQAVMGGAAEKYSLQARKLFLQERGNFERNFMAVIGEICE